MKYDKSYFLNSDISVMYVNSLFLNPKKCYFGHFKYTTAHF